MRPDKDPAITTYIQKFVAITRPSPLKSKKFVPNIVFAEMLALCGEDERTLAYSQESCREEDRRDQADNRHKPCVSCCLECQSLNELILLDAFLSQLLHPAVYLLAVLRGSNL